MFNLLLFPFCIDSGTSNAIPFHCSCQPKHQNTRSQKIASGCFHFQLQEFDQDVARGKFRALVFRVLNGMVEFRHLASSWDVDISVEREQFQEGATEEESEGKTEQNKSVVALGGCRECGKVPNSRCFS